MSVLGDDKTKIGDVLAIARPDRQIFTHVPEAVVPPATLVLAGSPYLERRDGDTFGTMTAAYELWIVQPNGTNEKTSTDLDDEIEAHIDALTPEGFTPERVDEPFSYVANGTNYLTTIITVTSPVAFEK